ncbi:hypothetical protein DITRI_Ditri09bG0098800 [Diplodiscus trichospermus]
MARPTATSTTNRASSSTSSVTTTVTIENNSGSSSSSQPQETLVLELRPRRKKVTWKEGTVDNEFMNKKSSKICCIFHKEKPFDEDDSDDDGHDHDHHHHPSEGHDSSKGSCRPSTST